MHHILILKSANPYFFFRLYIVLFKYLDYSIKFYRVMGQIANSTEYNILSLAYPISIFMIHWKLIGATRFEPATQCHDYTSQRTLGIIFEHSPLNLKSRYQAPACCKNLRILDLSSLLLIYFFVIQSRKLTPLILPLLGPSQIFRPFLSNTIVSL